MNDDALRQIVSYVFRKLSEQKTRGQYLNTMLYLLLRRKLFFNIKAWVHDNLESQIADIFQEFAQKQNSSPLQDNR